MVEFIQLISNMGFPIGCCVVMGIYIKSLNQMFYDRVNEITTKHKEEVTKLTEIISNNTQALIELKDMLRG